MDTDIDKIEKRTIQYWFQDGVFEITFGFLPLLLGLYLLGQALAPEKSPLRFILAVGLLPLFLLGGWGAKKAARHLKQKLTYPRTGYVSYRRPEGAKRVRRTWLAAGCAGILGALAAFLFTSRSGGFDWGPAASGLAFALVLAFVSLRAGLVRLAVVGFLAAAAGVALSFAGWGWILETAAFYIFLAVSMILSGVIGCRRYLRRNPIPAEASR